MEGRSQVTLLVAECQIRNSFISVTIYTVTTLSTSLSTLRWCDNHLRTPGGKGMIGSNSSMAINAFCVAPSSPPPLDKDIKSTGNIFHTDLRKLFLLFPHNTKGQYILGSIPYSFFIGNNTHCLAGSLMIGYLTS